jgi:mycofactocin precursor
MDDATTPVMDAETLDPTAVEPAAEAAALAELLIEEISIDGMCGVY